MQNLVYTPRIAKTQNASSLKLKAYAKLSFKLQKKHESAYFQF